MDALELRQLDSVDLQEKLIAKRDELWRLKLSFTAGSLENPKQIRNTRHDIARILTILRERELAMELVAQEVETGEGKNE